MQRSLGFLLLTLAGCATSPIPERLHQEEEDGPPIYLSEEQQLTRVSIALRGIRPSLEDYAALQEDAGALESLVDQYLDSDLFGETIRDMHAETLLMRSETVFLPALGPIADEYLGDVHRSLAEAPLMLIEDIVMSDSPYTEIITADYAMVDSRTARIWDGLTHSSGGPEWQASSIPPERPRAGILSSSELWMRHESNGANYHRQRANLISESLLCESFVERDIPLSGSIDLSDPEVVAEAVVREQSCVGCHQSLDPLAATLWGFQPKIAPGPVQAAYDEGRCDSGTPEGGLFPRCMPFKTYNPDLELAWDFIGLRPPGYFGLPAENLTEIGQAIAADPRFSLCAARRFFGYLTQTDQTEVPHDLVSDLQREFIDSGYSAKALARAVVLSDSFLAAEQGTDLHPIAGIQIIRPEAQARMIEDLTGFVWETDPDRPNCELLGRCWGDVDLSRSDAYGFRSMAGGIDGFSVTRPVHTAMPVRSLFSSILAKESAAFVVEADLAEQNHEDRLLLQLIDKETLDEEQVRDQLRVLHLRVLGEERPIDSTEVDESYALWEGLLELTATPSSPDGDTQRTWSLVIGAMLDDVAALYY